MYTIPGTSRKSALHVKFARLAPSVQYPQPPKLTNATLEQTATTSSPGTGSESAGLPRAGNQGFLDIVPEEGMSGGPVVDSQCGLLGVTGRKSLFGEGGAFVSLSPSIVQKIMAAMDQL